MSTSPPRSPQLSASRRKLRSFKEGLRVYADSSHLLCKGKRQTDKSKRMVRMLKSHARKMGRAAEGYEEQLKLFDRVSKLREATRGMEDQIRKGEPLPELFQKEVILEEDEVPSNLTGNHLMEMIKSRRGASPLRIVTEWLEGPAPTATVQPPATGQQNQEI